MTFTDTWRNLRENIRKRVSEKKIKQTWKVGLPSLQVTPTRENTANITLDSLAGMVGPSRPSADGRRYREKCLGGISVAISQSTTCELEVEEKREKKKQREKKKWKEEEEGGELTKEQDERQRETNATKKNGNRRPTARWKIVAGGEKKTAKTRMKNEERRGIWPFPKMI